MFIISQMLHTCEGRTILWDRGQWYDGLRVRKTCPECKKALPEVHKLTKVEPITTSWKPKHMGKETPPIEYQTLQVFKPTRKKRDKKPCVVFTGNDSTTFPPDDGGKLLRGLQKHSKKLRRE